MTLTQIYQFEKTVLPFALYTSEVLVLLLDELISAILWRSAPVTIFENILENTASFEQKKYITFVGLS